MMNMYIIYGRCGVSSDRSGSVDVLLVVKSSVIN